MFPKSFKASETIASLLGTIPCTPNACWNILPNGQEMNDDISTYTKIKKPNIVLMVPEVIVAAGFLFERLNL
ncbi:hypothetical protein ACVNP0_03535 [Staphylococcus aureus]